MPRRRRATARGGLGETLTISGGTVLVDAAGDGLDSNGTLTVSGETSRCSGRRTTATACSTRTGPSPSPGHAARYRLERHGGDPRRGLPGLGGGNRGRAGRLRSGVVDGAGAGVAGATSPRTASMVFYSSPELPDGVSYAVTVDGATVATATRTAVAGGMPGGPGGGMGGGPGRRP
ncbi:hypothetical protein G7085_04580 [Tessaracoccus sp. HDW20]|nr:hypothetical protein [Tessaracoccus coleopterorum]